MFSFQVLGIYPCWGGGGNQNTHVSVYQGKKKKENNINIKNSGNV